MTQWGRVILLPLCFHHQYYFLSCRFPCRSAGFWRLSGLQETLQRPFCVTRASFSLCYLRCLSRTPYCSERFPVLCRAVKSVLAVFLTHLISSFHGCPTLMLWKLLWTNLTVFLRSKFSVLHVFTPDSAQLPGQHKEAIFLTEQKRVHIINHKESKQIFSNTLVKDWMNP